MTTFKISFFVLFLILLMATPQYAQSPMKKKCNDYARLMQNAQIFIDKGDFRQALDKLNAAKACDPLQAEVVNKRMLGVFEKIEEQRASAKKAEKLALISKKLAETQTILANEQKQAADAQTKIAEEQKRMALREQEIAQKLRKIAEDQTELASIERAKAQAAALATKALQIVSTDKE